MKHIKRSEIIDFLWALDRFIWKESPDLESFYLLLSPFVHTKITLSSWEIPDISFPNIERVIKNFFPNINKEYKVLKRALSVKFIIVHGISYDDIFIQSIIESNIPYNKTCIRIPWIKKDILPRFIVPISYWIGKSQDIFISSDFEIVQKNI